MCSIYFCPDCDGIVEVLGEPAADLWCDDCGATLQLVDAELAADAATPAVALAMREG